jgi:hypothetical protein
MRYTQVRKIMMGRKDIQTHGVQLTALQTNIFCMYFAQVLKAFRYNVERKEILLSCPNDQGIHVHAFIRRIGTQLHT